jgi:hypothetical protein
MDLAIQDVGISHFVGPAHVKSSLEL